MKVELITKTIGIEGSLYENRSIDELIVGQARVSTSRSDEELFDTPEKLIRHCIINQHWCFDKETEILTSDGFKKVENITSETRVGSYNSLTKNVEFVIPTALNKQAYKGDLIGFENKNVSFLVTPNHRLLYKNSSNKLIVEEAEKVYTNNRRSSNFLTYAYSNSELDVFNIFKAYDDEIYKLIGFFIGDGSTKTSDSGLVFHIKKQKKKDYLKQICNKLNLKLDVTKNDHIVRDSKLKDLFHNLFYNKNSEKTLPGFFVTISNEKKEFLLDGLINSDGNITNGVVRYDTTSKDLVDSLQAIYCTSGYRVLLTKRARTSNNHKERYILVFSKQQYTSEKRGVKGGWYKKEYNDFVYCVSVKDSFVIIRRNNKVSISGNSIFELANLGFKVETSRAIGREILRHGTHIGLTEFSQRYAEVLEMEPVELRKQAQSNRQSSTEVFDPLIPDNSLMVYNHIDKIYHLVANAKESANYQLERETNRTIMMYNNMLEAGVARESARMILPETTKTTIYLNARIREIITFLNARLHKTAQKEIREIAELIRDIFIEQCPIIANALFNFEEAYEHHIIDQLVLEKYKIRHKILFSNE